ncbi:MAG: type II toxin-antitoxin system VapC family toxin [Chloroflexi bacterium]|nr:type II toxin-antitoxin system VapC family toxin [Chloroflexota bacterium]MDE2636136.1 type II toxin-antitoxin system VapC family toxin [Chloroflexota bacterium]
MKLDAAFRNVHRIYIDTAPLIYLVERNPHYIARMLGIVDFIESASLLGFTSVVALTEILVQPLRLGNTDRAQQYYDIIVGRYDFTLVSFTSEIAISAAAIRARYSLRTPDAIHVATAINMGCDAILTNDGDFRRVTDINVLVLDDLEL